MNLPSSNCTLPSADHQDGIRSLYLHRTELCKRRQEARFNLINEN